MGTLAASAASGVLHTVGGRTLEVRPLTLKDYGTLELCALKDYKQRRVDAYRDILGDIPESERSALLIKAAEENAKLDESDLPVKTLMLDQYGRVTMDSDECVSKRKVAFCQWWMSHTSAGRLTSVWLSVRKAHPEISREEVESLVMDDPSALDELANVVGEASQPKLGNEQEAT